MAVIALLIIGLVLFDAGFFLWVHFSTRNLPAQHSNHSGCSCPSRTAKPATDSPKQSG